MSRPAAPPPSESALAPDKLDTGEFARNMLTVGVKSQKLVLDFIARMASREEPGPIDPLNISGAMLARNVVLCVMAAVALL